MATSGRIISFSIFSYMIGLYLHARKERSMMYSVALTRKISRFTGFMCNMTLPPFMRSSIYSTYGYIYGVNYDDILEPDISNFRNFNQFFTRELKPEAR
jgi:phosphatidylserine decarboxylase